MLIPFDAFKTISPTRPNFSSGSSDWILYALITVATAILSKSKANLCPEISHHIGIEHKKKNNNNESIK